MKGGIAKDKQKVIEIILSAAAALIVAARAIIKFISYLDEMNLEQE